MVLVVSSSPYLDWGWTYGNSYCNHRDRNNFEVGGKDIDAGADEKPQHHRKTYGNDAQEDMAIEECSELVKAILKLRRSDEKTAETREAVIDEIADVQIMLSQLEIIFNCVAEVEDRIDFKINRQMGRIKEREAKRDVC